MSITLKDFEGWTGPVVGSGRNRVARPNEAEYLVESLRSPRVRKAEALPMDACGVYRTQRSIATADSEVACNGTGIL